MTDIVIRIDGSVLAKALADKDGTATDPSDLHGAAMQPLAKSTLKRYTLSLAYPADRPDVGRGRDGYRDFMKAEAVEDCAWRFLANNPEVGLWHKDGTEGHGTVVESYIYRGPDWPMNAVDGSAQLIKSGDWMLGVQWDEPTWDAIEAGFINGMSPQGRVRRDLSPTAAVLGSLRRN